MNERGTPLFILIIGAFFILALIPPVVMYLFPAGNLLMRVFLALMLYMTVKGYLGNSPLTLIITAALVYLLVIKHAYLTSSLFVFFYVLLAYQFLSVVIWGLSVTMRRG